MPPIVDPLNQKKSFLRENDLFTELELNEDSKPIGKLQDIDLAESEIWLLQCPKGMNVKEFENQKLKIPGRTNIQGSEAISMEFNNGKEQHALSYCRKGQYFLRLLPIRGTIVIRDRLKAAETVTSERAEECNPPAKRVPFPSAIRVRHPLLGSQYNDKVYLDASIKKRLQNADENSIQILKETLNQKLLSCTKATTVKKKDAINERKNLLPAEINSADDEIFVGDEKLKIKKKKSKRKHSDSRAEENMDAEKSSAKKKKKGT